MTLLVLMQQDNRVRRTLKMRQYYRDKKKLLRTLSSETAESLLKQTPAATFEQFEMHTHRIIV